MTPAAKTYQRRTILVKRSLQIKYIAYVFGCVLLAVLIVGGDVYYTLAKEILIDNPALAPLLAKVNNVILMKLVLYFGIVFITAAVASHRLAGPIYRFEQSARELARGDLLHRVGLRGGDELLDLQTAFNGMASSLQTKVQKDRNLAQRISARLQRLADATADPQAVEELRSLKREVDHLTAEFKV